jgi:hypothetical protein
MPDPKTQSDGAPAGSIDVPVAADSPTSFSAMPMAAPPTTTSASATEASPPAPPPAPALRGPRRQWVVVIGILVATIISLLSISVLYYKWYRSDEYDTIIIVWGPRDWDGAVAKVSGPALPTGGLSYAIREEDNYVIRFHVPPGEYSVRVVKDGKVLDQRTTPRRLGAKMIWWPFRAPPAATQMHPR